MAKAIKLPSGNYRAQGSKTVNGKQIRKSFTAPTKAEAEYLASKWMVSVVDESKPENKTLREICEMYIELKRPILSPTTISGYEKVLRNNFQEYMNVKVSKLTRLMLQQMIGDECMKVNRRGVRMSPKSVANAWTFVSSALRQYGYEFKVQLPERPDKVVQILSPETILAVVKGTNIELPVLLGCWCSLSMSEIRGAMASDIRDGILYISRVIVDVDGVPTIKDKGKEEKRTRAIRLPQYILDLCPKEGYLVPMRGNTIYKHWTKILEDNDLPHMTFHQTRHIFATAGAMLNIPSKVLQEKGGWKTDYTMKKVYQHTFTEDRREADDKIDEYFEKLL